MDYLFCPLCGDPLTAQVEGHPACEHKGGEGRPASGCGKFVWWNNPIPCVAVVCPIFRQGNLNVILVKRGVEPSKGKWCLPCGYINANEDPNDAARRETLEEAGVKIELVRVLDTMKAFDQKLNQLIIFYLGRVVGGELAYGDDAAGIGVFHASDLPDMAFESHTKVINEFFAGRWPYSTAI